MKQGGVIGFFAEVAISGWGRVAGDPIGSAHYSPASDLPILLETALHTFVSIPTVPPVVA